MTGLLTLRDHAQIASDGHALALQNLQKARLAILEMLSRTTGQLESSPTAETFLHGASRLQVEMANLLREYAILNSYVTAWASQKAAYERAVQELEADTELLK